MDAVKFLEERKRMFKNGKSVPDLGVNVTYNSEKVVKLVEEWSAAHPRKTRQSVFLEQYPEALFAESGVMLLCPRYISAAHRNGDGMCKDPTKKCVDCSYEFWMQEVEK